jgi:putative ABC transport system permease protein
VTWRVLLRESWRGLIAARHRSAFAALGILVGVASVIAIASTAAMVHERAETEFRDLGTDIVGVHWDPARARRAVEEQEIRLLRAAVPGLAETQPIVRGKAAVVSGGREWTWEIFGVAPGFARQLRLRTAEGRFLSALDQSATYCVLGHQVAEGLRGGQGSLVGRPVRVGGRLMVVAGVLAPTAPSPVLEMTPDRTVFLSLGAATRLGSGAVAGVLGRLAPGSDPRLAGEAIREFFRRRARGLEVEVRSAEELLATMRQQLRLLTLVFGIVGAIALVLGGVGVMNAMLLVVSERRHEIGVRRALGATRGEIERQFLCEAAGVALAGALAGIACGAGVARAIAWGAGWGFELSPLGVAMGAGAALALGLACGTYPARRAARLSPVEALHA